MTAKHYKKIRLQLGLTQAGLAAVLEVAPITILRRENGQRPVSEEAALAIMSLVAEDH